MRRIGLRNDALTDFFERIQGNPAIILWDEGLLENAIWLLTALVLSYFEIIGAVAARNFALAPGSVGGA